MRFLLLGVIVGVLASVLCFFLNSDDSKMIVGYLLVLGLIPIILSGFMSGAYVSGDRNRANYSDSKEFRERSGRGTNLFLLGMPLILAAIAIHFVQS